MMAFNSRTFQFRELVSLLSIMFVTLLVQNYFHVTN